MNRALKATALAVLVALLAACGAPDSGTVTMKRFTPGHTYLQRSCVLVAKVPVCHYVPTWVGDEWELRIDDGEDAGWTDVDQTTYGRVTVGSHWPEAGDQR